MVTLSVYLDGGFWVGVLEVQDEGSGVVRAVRFVLGGEPTDPELYAYLQRHGVALLRQAAAAPPVAADRRDPGGRVNPKRAAKLAARAAARVPPQRGTAAQEAMRLELESRKAAASAARRDLRREQDEQRREAARRKRLARRRGH
ncbi:DUF2992 family protein [Actinomadura sp. ATCC 31491]|uniref:DUF2992 family protein n=1 Tax=Actinomadura luzonensis TaxID=2805427 RepID=A0ABT0FSH6_9ACTN|nr:DUF2992 family protein [Actinomadura luzonensis]MCK2214950.1 DUF2992 family protein [Actinomadura luzonensis]